MPFFARLRRDVAVLPLGATLSCYVLLVALVAVYAAWVVFHPVSEAIAK
jgi:hypothetical protein